MSVRWLVVGIGDITTKRVLPAILAESRSELWGIVTRNPEKAEPYQTRVFTDYEAALRNPEIDVVYVATPVAMHAPQTIAALQAGKHVLCEKPVALNHTEAWCMGEAADRAGRILGIAYYRRLYPNILRAKELIAQGAIGRPVLAEMNNHSWLPADSRGWLLDPALAGGGPLYDIGSHRIDLLNFFFGKPVRVTGQRANVVHDKAVEDAATVMVEYEGGVRGVVDVRWHSRVYRDACRFIGTDGEIDLTPLNSGRVVYPGGEDLLPPHDNLHYPLIENYVTAVLEGRPPVCPLTEAAVTDWVTEQVMTRGDHSRYV